MRRNRFYRQALQEVVTSYRIEAIAAEAHVNHIRRLRVAQQAAAIANDDTVTVTPDDYFEAVATELRAVRRLLIAESMLQEETRNDR